MRVRIRREGAVLGRRLGETEAGAIVWTGIIQAGMAVSLVVVTPVWGTIADRYGAKLMVCRAMLGGGALFIVISFAGRVEQLLVLFLLLGCFTGVNTAIVTLVSGIAPRAYLGNYKALSVPTDADVGLDGNAAEIVAAIEAAVADGMDVINLSLGEPEVEPSRDLVALALDGAAAAGVVPDDRGRAHQPGARCAATAERSQGQDGHGIADVDGVRGGDTHALHAEQDPLRIRLAPRDVPRRHDLLEEVQQAGLLQGPERVAPRCRADPEPPASGPERFE